MGLVPKARSSPFFGHCRLVTVSKTFFAGIGIAGADDDEVADEIFRVELSGLASDEGIRPRCLKRHLAGALQGSER